MSSEDSAGSRLISAEMADTAVKFSMNESFLQCSCQQLQSSAIAAEVSVLVRACSRMRVQSVWIRVSVFLTYAAEEIPAVRIKVSRAMLIRSLFIDFSPFL